MNTAGNKGPGRRFGPTAEYEIVNGIFLPVGLNCTEQKPMQRLQLIAGVLRKIPDDFQVEKICGEFCKDNKLFYRVGATDCSVCFVPAEQLCNDYNFPDLVAEYIARGRVVWKVNEQGFVRPTGQHEAIRLNEHRH